ncbi:MAG: lyase family protein [Acidobacteriota bacterium]
MSRLWDRGEPVDERIARFTTGRDPELDCRLVPFDALASAAHAAGLLEIGILSESEFEALRRELAVIARQAVSGEFEVRFEDEDGHTAIENRLVERLGEAGKRIHTGRSRNDQVIAATRLFARRALLDLGGQVLGLADRLLALADEHREVSVPGYTHARQAVPSTLGFLFAAHAEGLLAALPWLRTAYEHVDRSPLGSAAGYGVPLPLARQTVADKLAFSAVQENTLAVQNDRGKGEFLVLAAVLGPVLDMGRLAADLIWFASDELRFVRLATAVTTGSSIMPQKRNPDVLELVRAGSARWRSRQAEIAAIAGPLSSGYHRDLQLTKEPFLEAMVGAGDLLAAMLPVLETLEVDAERCRAAFQRSIGATDEVFRRVAEGEPFRTAYKAVAQDPEGAVSGDPAESWRLRTHLGAPGALDLDASRRRRREAAEWLRATSEREGAAWDLLAEER